MSARTGGRSRLATDVQLLREEAPPRRRRLTRRRRRQRAPARRRCRPSPRRCAGPMPAVPTLDRRAGAPQPASRREPCLRRALAGSTA
ncbi:MAG: hypothetical protein MZW92_59975 [Comamonadaceae bacterium]|nr:hypothetical protein [Comamonadaceae bacterium]